MKMLRDVRKDRIKYTLPVSNQSALSNQTQKPLSTKTPACSWSLRIEILTGLVGVWDSDQDHTRNQIVVHLTMSYSILILDSHFSSQELAEGLKINHVSPELLVLTFMQTLKLLKRRLMLKSSKPQLNVTIKLRQCSPVIRPIG